MNDVLEQMIEDSLARRAATVQPGPGLDTGAVLVAGGRARRRRTGALAAAVAALAVGVAALVVLPRGAPPTVAPLPGPAGLDVLSAGHGIIVRGDDGRRVRIESPDADKVSAAIGVPGGWVAEADLSPTVRRLLFVSFDGTTKTITTYASYGGYVLSTDGRLLVVTGVLDDQSAAVVAYDLPSLDRHSGLVFSPVAGPFLPAGIAGPQVLLVPDDSEYPYLILRNGDIWSLDTGGTTPVRANAATVLGVSAHGDVLYAWGHNDAHNEQTTACVTVVPLPQLEGAQQAPATCRPATTMPTGTISPDGTALFLDGPADFRGMYHYDAPGRRFSARTALPAEFDGYHAEYGYNQQWISGGSGPRVVLDATRGGRPLYRYVACDVTGRCTPIAMPPGLDRPVPVAHLPG